MLWKSTVVPELLETIQSLHEDNIFEHYFLAGGTALALQTGYRTSKDIDLFTFNKQDNESLKEYFKNKFNGIKIDADKPGLLQLTVDNIMIDLCRIRGNMLESPNTEENVRMFSLKDIAAMKLSAICDRKRAKDYCDIAYLLKHIFNIEEMFHLYKKKYNEIDTLRVKKELMNYNKVNPYEWQSVNILDKYFFVSNVPGIIKDNIEKYNKKNGFKKR
jgi:predicted nucleotidyltransferase component of viral defense system